MLYARIPSDRLGVLIGPEGATKKRLQESTGTRIAVDSATGDVTIDETAAADPVLALKARDVVQAMAPGSPKTGHSVSSTKRATWRSSISKTSRTPRTGWPRSGRG